MRFTLLISFSFLFTPFVFAQDAEDGFEGAVELPFSSRKVPFEFVRQLSIMEFDDAIPSIEGKGVRVFRLNQKKEFSQLTHFKISPTEVESLKEAAIHGVKQSDALFFKKDQLVFLAKKPPFQFTQDTILVLSEKDPLPTNLLSHEWLHKEVAALSLPEVFGLKLWNPSETLAALKQLLAELDKLEDVKSNSSLRSEVMTKIFYVEAMDHLERAYEELEVHMLFREQRLSKGSYDVYAAGQHMLNLVKALKTMKGHVGRMAIEPESTETTKKYANAVLAVDGVARKLAKSFVEYAEKNLSSAELRELNEECFLELRPLLAE